MRDSWTSPHAKDVMIACNLQLSSGGVFIFAAEAYRIRASVTLRANVGDQAGAIADLRKALEIANVQDARGLELRAARDLAILLAEAGAPRRAADLLRPVYAAFKEGFDTPDLREAKELLDALI